jgi:hypothetical protein
MLTSKLHFQACSVHVRPGAGRVCYVGLGFIVVPLRCWLDDVLGWVTLANCPLGLAWAFLLGMFQIISALPSLPQESAVKKS